MRFSRFARRFADVLLLSVFVAPAIALSATICEKYEADIRGLAGEGQVTFAPLMSRPNGALDRSPPKEIGCQAQGKPSGRSVVLGLARPENGAGNAARATKDNYIKGGLKPIPTPEPGLGSEGFSLLTTIASEPKPNYLVVVGHRGTLGVQLTIQKGSYSKSELTDLDTNRAKALVKTVLDDFR